MLKSFTPRLDVLPASQQRLWPELSAVPAHFVLYGGTALALRLGHRQSVDFDFFSSRPFAAAELLEALPFLRPSEVLQRHGNTLTVLVDRGGPVKLSFFGTLNMGRVGEPDLAGPGLKIASLLDLAGTKAAVVQMRAESKDYLDLFAVLRAGIALPEVLSAAQALYAEQFNPALTLKSLTYFEDGDLRALPAEVKRVLVEAVAATREIPVLKRVSDEIAPA